MKTPIKLEKVQTSTEAGRELALDLRSIAMQLSGDDRHEIAALALRLYHCNSNSNHWFADEIYDKTTGEVFEGNGQYWRCGSKLCPSCLKHQSQRSRKRLRDAMQNQKLLVGEYFHFITLTMPNPSLPLRQTRELINRAWSRFRKRKMFADLVKGGVKSEEFTFTRRGYHYHLHLIVRSKYLDFIRFRRVWTECLDAAFEEFGIEFSPKTADGLVLVNIQRVHSREKAINEVCKYITKSDSWRRIPRRDLIELSLTRRFPRMFEIFGCFKDEPINKTILDTRDISDGEEPLRPVYWRDEVRDLGIHAYAERLLAEIVACRTARSEQLRIKWPFATFLELAALI